MSRVTLQRNPFYRRDPIMAGDDNRKWGLYFTNDGSCFCKYHTKVQAKADADKWDLTITQGEEVAL